MINVHFFLASIYIYEAILGIVLNGLNFLNFQKRIIIIKGFNFKCYINIPLYLFFLNYI